MRQIEKLLSEIAQENGYEYRTFSDGWVIKLSKNNKTKFVYGYKFPCNNAAAEQLCDDKPALYEALSAASVLAAEHIYFPPKKGLSEKENKFYEEKRRELLKKYGKLCLKPLQGSGGKNVFKAETQAELEYFSEKLLSRGFAMSISPFLDIAEEYRVILLNGKIKTIFSKERPSVTGDGKSDISKLMEASSIKISKYDLALSLSYIPDCGERVYVSWKHNLGRGGVPRETGRGELYDKLSSIALKAAKSVSVNFASVDIISVGGELMVLEINSGVMMERFSAESPENYKKAKEIYKEAIESPLA